MNISKSDQGLTEMIVPLMLLESIVIRMTGLTHRYLLLVRWK